MERSCVWQCHLTNKGVLVRHGGIDDSKLYKASAILNVLWLYVYSLPRGAAPQQQQPQQQQQANAGMLAGPPRNVGPASPGTVEAIARELEEPDDTMKNLRKTFAGIFGDM